MISRPWIALICLTPASLATGGSLLFAPPESSLRVEVPKAGLMSFAGHEHTIEAGDFKGILLIDSPNQSPMRIDLSVATERLEVTDAQLDADTRGKVRKDMLSKQVLSSEAHPCIRFISNSITVVSEGHWQLEGKLSLAGSTSAVAFPVSIEWLSKDQLLAKGEVEVALKDFGIKPVSALGGLIRTGKTVRISFHFVSQNPKETP
jgi:polyisoprenoid-binding protein YceI